MKLKIIENISGQSFVVKGRPGISTISIFIFLFFGVIYLFLNSTDLFALFAVFGLLVIFLVLTYRDFIKLEIYNPRGLFFRTGLKKEQLILSTVKKFKTYFVKRTAKGTTIYATDITAFCEDGEINIFHATFGGWGKKEETAWQEIKKALASFAEVIT